MGEQRACEDEGAGRAVAAVGLEYCSDVTTNGEGIRGGKLEDGTSEATASIDGAIERRCDEECCALVLNAAAGMAAASWSVASSAFAMYNMTSTWWCGVADFIDSARRVLATMESATGEQWAGAAFRLKGLAASFGAVRLMTLAAEAALAPVGDPTTLRRLHRAIDRF